MFAATISDKKETEQEAQTIRNYVLASGGTRSRAAGSEEKKSASLKSNFFLLKALRINGSTDIKRLTTRVELFISALKCIRFNGCLKKRLPQQ